MATTKLTPKRVDPMSAPADPAHITVVCEDENGNTINVYLRDEEIGAAHKELDTRRKAAEQSHGEATTAAREAHEAAVATANEALEKESKAIAKEHAPLETKAMKMAAKEIARREKEAAEKSEPSPAE